MPYQINGKAASSTDESTWVDFLTAKDHANKFDGIGFVLDGDGLIGVDIDSCIDPDTGEYNETANRFLREVPGYWEISPSGVGIKGVVRSDLQNSVVDHKMNLEIYRAGRFFTITGKRIHDTLDVEVPFDLTDYLPRQERKSIQLGRIPPSPDWDIAKVAKELLQHIDPDSGYSEWIRVGMALHHQFEGSDDALELWDQWSCKNGESTKYEDGGCAAKWDSFQRNEDASTIRSLIWMKRQKVFEEEENNGKVILEGTHFQHTERLLEELYSDPNGPTLLFYSKEFYQYDGKHWVRTETEAIKAACLRYLSVRYRFDAKGNVVPYDTKPATVNNLVETLQQLVHLPDNEDAKPPVWFGKAPEGYPAANELVSVQNGLYWLKTGTVMPHTSRLFTMTTLPFEFDPEATAPEWLKFLETVWPVDPEHAKYEGLDEDTIAEKVEDARVSIELLQDWFGYIVSQDTKLQKFMFIKGPSRSGKGTITRILQSLVGPRNCTSPTIDTITEQFGLQPWLGKTLAVFNDVRSPEKGRTGIVSRLLLLAANDTVSVNRKNLPSWEGQLPTRLMMASNELLKFSESSSAMIARMLVLRMAISHVGKEDLDLEDRLKDELSGIFNWAILGYQRLKERRKFIMADSGRNELRQQEQTTNLMLNFIEDYFEFGADARLSSEDMFHLWRAVSREEGLTGFNHTLRTAENMFLSATQDKGVEGGIRVKRDGRLVNGMRGVQLNNEGLEKLKDNEF